jgi:hypothetical protein
MDHKAKKTSSGDESFDLTALLHPARAFARPMDVVEDHDLTLSEKRAILAAWASDACAVEANPTLRSVTGRSTARFDEIMDALRELDRLGADRCKPIPHYRRVLERRNTAPRHPSGRGGDSGDHGAPMH